MKEGCFLHFDKQGGKHRDRWEMVAESYHKIVSNGIDSLRKLSTQKWTSVLDKQMKCLSVTSRTQEHKINLRKGWKPESSVTGGKAGKILSFSVFPLQ